jgi:hypothetical protein
MVLKTSSTKSTPKNLSEILDITDFTACRSIYLSGMQMQVKLAWKTTIFLGKNGKQGASKLVSREHASCQWFNLLSYKIHCIICAHYTCRHFAAMWENCLWRLGWLQRNVYIRHNMLSPRLGQVGVLWRAGMARTWSKTNM